jgi:hypothetical protein
VLLRTGTVSHEPGVPVHRRAETPSVAHRAAR